MERIKVGIIGAGKMGVLHACTYNKLQDCELTAICDNTPLNLKLLRSLLPNVRLYNDYERMLSDSPLDLAVVATPVFLHERMALKAMEMGLAVFVEKPLALNGKECHELVTRAIGRPTMVGYCRRFMATYNLAKRCVEEQTLGQVIGFDSHMFVTQVGDERAGWQYDAKRSGGGVVMDLGSHGVDMLHHLLGDVSKVSGTTKQNLSAGVEDSAVLSFRLHSGIEGHMKVSWKEPGFRLPELMFDLRFEHGRVRVCEKFLEITDDRDENGTKTYFKQMLEKGVQINIAGPEYTREDEHMARAVLDGRPTKCDFAEAAKTNYVIEMAYRSMARDGGWFDAGWQA